mmetsp:Transcript_48674/g.81824  ORF Transcript_48674/g.81824 Transcript_48674/m.81824 type:complete len:223 (-) Transcript_48674:1189-1857(-)
MSLRFASSNCSHFSLTPARYSSSFSLSSCSFCDSNSSFSAFLMAASDSTLCFHALSFSASSSSRCCLSISASSFCLLIFLLFASAARAHCRLRSASASSSSSRWRSQRSSSSAFCRRCSSNRFFAWFLRASSLSARSISFCTCASCAALRASRRSCSFCICSSSSRCLRSTSFLFASSNCSHFSCTPLKYSFSSRCFSLFLCCSSSSISAFLLAASISTFSL